MTRLASYDQIDMPRHATNPTADHVQRIALENAFSPDGNLMTVSHVIRTNVTDPNNLGRVALAYRTT